MDSPAARTTAAHGQICCNENGPAVGSPYEKGPRMAATLSRFGTFLSVMLFLLVSGCSQPTVVSSIPEPNFNGPQIAPQVVAVKPEPKFVEPKRPVAGRLTGPKDWSPTAPPRSWRWVVIHHSATPGGNAAMFAKMHRD